MESISISRLAMCGKAQGLIKEMLAEHFKELGIISDIRTVTPKGTQYGITYCQSGSSSLPVYPESIQVYVQKYIPQIIEKYGYVREQIEAEKAVRDAERKQQRAERQQKKQEALKAMDQEVNEKKYAYLDIDNFVILDTETTELTDNDEVIELGIVDMNGTVLYEKRFRPDVPINPFAAKVNHLSAAILKDCPKFSETDWDEIRNIIGERKILGHNIPFDARLIRQTFARYTGKELVTDVFDDMYDSKDIAKKWLRVEKYNLNDLTTYLGITREEQHSATDDCVLTLEFLNRLEDVINIRRNYKFVKC